MRYLAPFYKGRWQRVSLMDSSRSTSPGPERDSEDGLLSQKEGRHYRLYERDETWPPAIGSLEWGTVDFGTEDQIQEFKKYVGKPSPEIDRAWHNLLNAENVMIEEEYVRAQGREGFGVRIPDGEGYIGTLNVYHQIHCLKRIHQSLHPDYYFTGFTAQQHDINRVHNGKLSDMIDDSRIEQCLTFEWHAEHCIKSLLQSAICHGDVGLITFGWLDGYRIPVANETSRQCVNWAKLENWVKDRAVDMMKPGWLIHPTMGPAYDDDKGGKPGASMHHHGPS
ncbi:hypothetical protein Trco_006998 [Trichoderma cornu-damae]|uniref:Uncharacterized protein n=1 Tax=Trichoderma cornu-damae TaxID=654480 RepID=A0A9P8QFY9_9HYPO|nr:hypothetical protein Trco_006998 [Trichoderma cornu-damae]